MKTFYKEATAKAHILITMYMHDLLADEECKSPYQAIQIMKNCVDDAYAQILGAEPCTIELDEDDEDLD